MVLFYLCFIKDNIVRIFLKFLFLCFSIRNFVLFQNRYLTRYINLPFLWRNIMSYYLQWYTRVTHSFHRIRNIINIMIVLILHSIHLPSISAQTVMHPLMLLSNQKYIFSSLTISHHLCRWIFKGYYRTFYFIVVSQISGKRYRE